MASGENGNQARGGLSARALFVMVLGLAVAGAIAWLAAGTDGAGDEPSSDLSSLRAPWIDPDGIAPIVGSLDVNPADQSLWLATNTGMWRLKRGASRPQRVTGRLDTAQGGGTISEQLVVRFQGPDRMLASGHPPAESSLPRALGLIESRDGGRSWASISQLGRGDFHALQLSGGAIVA